MANLVTPFWIYLIGILWSLILDGLLVERGNGYSKIRWLSHQFRNSKETFVFYIVEIAIISSLITYLSQTLILSLLTTKPELTIVISVLVGWVRFHYDIYGRTPFSA